MARLASSNWLKVSVAVISAVICTTAILTGAANRAAAADEVPTVRVTPSSVTLEPGDSVQLSVLIENPTASSVVLARIDALAPPGISADVSGVAVPGSLAARSSTMADLRVTAGTGVRESVVGIVVDFRQPGDSGIGSLADAELAIKPGSGPVSLVASFDVFPDKLNDGESRPATVRLENPTAFAYSGLIVSGLERGDVELDLAGELSPPFVSCPASTSVPGMGHSLACLTEIASGATVLLDLNVEASDSVRTGNHQVGLVVTGSRDVAEGGAPLPLSSVVVTDEVELAVFGVDAISPFGLGTLFVLPGLLAVVFFLLLSRYVYPKSNKLPDTIELKDLRAMPFVIAFAAVSYLVIWAAWGTDLRRGVSTGNVILLFVVGLGLGVVAWGLVALLYWYSSGRKHFTVGDDPAGLLRRLRARDAGLVLPEFKSSGIHYLVLGPSEGQSVFAAPKIRYTFSAVDDQERRSFYSAVGSGDIDEILRAHRDKKVALNWSAPSGVRTFEESAVQPTAQEQLIDQQVEDEP